MFKFLPALLIALAIVVAGCGESQEKKQLDQLTQNQATVLADTIKEINALSNQVARLSADNKRIAESARALEFDMQSNQRSLDDLANRMGELQSNLGTHSGALRQQAGTSDRQVATSGGWLWNLFKIFVIIVFILIIIGLAIFFLRGRGDYNEEDDDLADFEDDGFEDDYEDDFEEEDFLDDKEKKAGEGFVDDKDKK